MQIPEGMTEREVLEAKLRQLAARLGDVRELSAEDRHTTDDVTIARLEREISETEEKLKNY